MKKILSTIAFLCVAAMALAAAPEGHLFRFERSKNRNYICYDVNLNNDILDTKEPISVYWIRAEEGGEKKELSFFQRKMAFGYKVVNRGKNEVTIHLTAYDKLDIKVCRRSGKWVALCTMNGKNIQINKMFAQLRSPNSLHVEYVDIYGINLATGKSIRERIANKD